MLAVLLSASTFLKPTRSHDEGRQETAMAGHPEGHHSISVGYPRRSNPELLSRNIANS